METTLNFPQHLLSTRTLSLLDIGQILDMAQQWVTPTGQLLSPPTLLKNKTVVNLFFENSTRTRSAFELAAKRLGADVINFEANISSTQKGESIEDTVDNLRAMDTDIFIIRHAEDQMPQHVAQHISNETRASLSWVASHVINAGDGCNEHPTQALLDAFTIRHYKKRFTDLSVAIVGDIMHSRVAKSNIHTLTTLGVPDIRLVGPKELLPSSLVGSNISLHENLTSGLSGADVVMALRIQRERMQAAAIPNPQDYFQQFGLTAARLQLAKPDAIVMHPAPMNRGVEIADEVADGPQSVILSQVTFGVAVRMAVLGMLCLP